MLFFIIFYATACFIALMPIAIVITLSDMGLLSVHASIIIGTFTGILTTCIFVYFAIRTDEVFMKISVDRTTRKIKEGLIFIRARNEVINQEDQK